MRIFIITMDDPILTKTFIRQIIDYRKKDIIGVAMPDGDRLTLSKGKSKYQYVLSLLLIMGIYHFLKNALISVLHKARKKLKNFGLTQDPTILSYAEKLGIPTFKMKSPNNKEFLMKLTKLQPDIIINQSQSIIKKELLSIPTIGTINRHNALLPRNRGRLTPFWVLYKGEKESGVSIHFLTEKLDAGDIIVQERYTISEKDTFNTLVKRNYEIAPRAILRAIDLLEAGFTGFLPNPEEMATYNSTPTLAEAWQYRKMRIRTKFKFVWH
jgi:methionyl-tRNA formyltransferase